MLPPDSGAPILSEHSRRTFVGRTAAAAAAGGLLWAAPSILTVDAAAAGSCGTGGTLNWADPVFPSLPTIPTYPFAYTSNTVVTTITRVTNGSATADSFGVGTPKSGLGGQASEYLYLRMNRARTGSVMSVTFAFSKAVNNLTFTLFDIDGSATQTWQDQLIVTSIPALTAFTTTKTGVGNNPSGAGTAVSPLQGTGSVGDTTSDGNARIKFSAPVTSVTLTYSAIRPTRSTTDQYIGLGNLTWNGCT